MSLVKFENTYWTNKDQSLVFRHQAALSLINEGPVLDLGCGDGLFLKILKQRGINAYGIDISDIAVEKCKSNGLAAEKHDFGSEVLRFKDGEFSCVALLDVLEHLYDPGLVLREASRVGASVVVSVPNFSSFPARLQVLLGQIPENNRHRTGHIYWFNYKALNSLIKDSGLQIEIMKCNFFWEDKIIIGWMIKRLGRLWPALFALSFVLRLKKIDA